MHLNPHSAQAPAGTLDAALHRAQADVGWGGLGVCMGPPNEASEPPAASFDMLALQ